jgi:hypothetical protein
VTNTLAYCGTELNAAVKSFVIEAPGGIFRFLVLIVDREELDPITVMRKGNSIRGPFESRRNDATAVGATADGIATLSIFGLIRKATIDIYCCIL